MNSLVTKNFKGTLIVSFFVSFLLSQSSFATIAAPAAQKSSAEAKSAESKTESKPEKKSSESSTTSGISHANRNYPGGRDEEDLKVQETLTNPIVKTDRHAIEAKVLKITSKKVNSDEPEDTEQ